MRPRFLLGLLCCLPALPAAFAGTETVQTFRLEDVKGARAFGPFEFREGARIVLDARVYDVLGDEETGIRFRDAGTREAAGPFAFTEGRIVKIGEHLFTIIDIRRLEVAPRSAPSARGPGKTLSSPARSPAPPPAPPVPDSPRDAELGLLVSPLSRTEYDVQARGLDGAPETLDLSRRYLALYYRETIFSLRGGLSVGAEWEDDFSAAAGGNTRLEDVRGEDGQGGFLCLALRYPAWQAGAWEVAVDARASYLWEEHRLRFERRQQVTTVVPDPTNETAQVTEVITVFDAVQRDVTLKESLVWLGIEAARAGKGWGCSAGVRFPVLADTDFRASLAAGAPAATLELEHPRSPVFTAGLSADLGRFVLRAEGKLGEVQSLTLGLTRRL